MDYTNQNALKAFKIANQIIRYQVHFAGCRFIWLMKGE